METENDDPIEEGISSQPYYLETITASEVKSQSRSLVTPEEAPYPPLLLPSLLKSRPPERQLLPPPDKDRAIDELFSLKLILFSRLALFVQSIDVIWQINFCRVLRVTASACLNFLSILHKKTYFFLFYTSIFTKHPHQFIYSITSFI